MSSLIISCMYILSIQHLIYVMKVESPQTVVVVVVVSFKIGLKM